MYTYMATVTRVIDGDTFVASVDLGFSVSMEMTIRMAGIDAPEKSTPEGQAAANALRFLIMPDPVKIVTKKDRQEKFGRYLADVYMFADMTEITVNEQMVKHGHAKPYDGGKR